MDEGSFERLSFKRIRADLKEKIRGEKISKSIKILSSRIGKS